MRASIGSPAALIVDDDVAFILWLGEMFTESGYQAFPALRFREALALAKSLTTPLHVLVVNPKMRGAARGIEALKSTQPDLKVVLIRDPTDESPIAPIGHATLERPSAGEPISKEQWMTKIRKVLMRFSAAR